jgi:histidine triad (HIT) family protein
MSYDPANIFAKILRGEAPAHKVLEDADTLAFLDLFPRCDGHTLVVPKTSARNILDATPAQLAAIMRSTQRISRAVLTAFSAQGVSILQFNEAAGGQVVFHLHFHVVPRWDGKPMPPPGKTMEKPEVLAANAERIRKALAAA